MRIKGRFQFSSTRSRQRSAATPGGRWGLGAGSLRLAALLFWVGLLACSGGPTSEPAAARQPSNGEALLARLIAFHDAEGAWSSGDFVLELEESRPDGTVRSTTLALYDGGARARIETQRDGHEVVMNVAGDAVAYQVDGNASAEVAQELIQALRLERDQVLRTRNYYAYLYGLPMKLHDPGTRIANEIREVDFRGRRALELRATYDPEVGSDTWLFYADPETFELIGYRFFHDEAAGDGETIVLEGLADVGPLRLPKRRTWFTNQGDELLGIDTISSARWLAP